MTRLRELAAKGPVHFMGIGGAGMCALAELVLRSGGRVSGCDLKHSQAGQDLIKLGASIEVGHDPTHLAGSSALVMTSAVPQDHPEVTAARAAGIQVFKRAEALGDWVAGEHVVAVAGTHGKTTTTAMTTEILAVAGLNPTGLVGGRVVGWESNLRFGSDSLFVVEADEYDKSFLTLSPDVALVTNVEADHLDIYSDFSGVLEGFVEFVSGLREGGRVIICADDYGATSLLPRLGSTGYTYGTTAGSMLRATDVTVTPEITHCVVSEGGNNVGYLEISDGGRHMLLNALGASAVARSMGVEWAVILHSLSSFRGVSRRFERIGRMAGVEIIDDYAHHPTEVAVTLEAARSIFPGARLVAVFQPHLYSRTKQFSAEFGTALSKADVLWVTDIFPAREAPIPGVSGEVLASAARAAGKSEVHYHPNIETISEALVDASLPGDVLLTLGAGSIESLGESLLGQLRRSAHA